LVVADGDVSEAYADMPQQPESQSGMSLAQVMTILSAHWKMSVAILVAVLLGALVLSKVLPRTYVAISTLMVNSPMNDPLAGGEQMQTAAGFLPNYVATQIDLVQSSDVLDAVIDRLDLSSDPEYASGNKGGTTGLREWVETKLRKNLEIEQGKGGSQLIYVTASAPNPVQAADIANAVAEAFTSQQDQRMNGPASDRAKRYAEELADLKKKVSAAQDAASQFRNRSGTIDLDTKVDVEMDKLTNLEHRLLEVRNSQRSNLARTAGNQEVSAAAMGSQTVRTLREEDARLRSKMAQLRTSLGPNHPQIIELQSQIDANSRSLSAALASFANATSSDIAVSSSEVASLEKTVNEQREKVLEGRRFRDEGAKYQLELESAQTAYKRALDGYDQIMFVHSTNINIAGRARPPVKADKPNVVKFVSLGIVLGILLGLVVPFVYELLNRRVRCRDDLERDFGIPVLIELPAIEPAHSPA
jgi:uncharacterized protein involved in exopolysaccharide biosynthesis